MIHWDYPDWPIHRTQRDVTVVFPTPLQLSDAIYRIHKEAMKRSNAGKTRERLLTIKEELKLIKYVL